MEITKEEFKAYENLRIEGLFNMFNVKAVCNYTNLTREKVFYIMKNYDELFKNFILNEVEKVII